MRESSWIAGAALLLLRRVAMLTLGICAACGIGRLLSPAGAPAPIPAPAPVSVEEPGGPPPAPSSAGLRPAPEVDGGSGSGEIAVLRRRLLLPLPGVGPEELLDSFADPRGGHRVHQAIDIPAARNTPVLAADDGTVARLLESRLGGLSLYQLDVAGAYAFYYAHLEGYRRGLEEGERLRRGEVIGYVGTSGNAPADAPHLHFAIYRLGAAKRWQEGKPINPYRVFGPERRDRRGKERGR